MGRVKQLKKRIAQTRQKCMTIDETLNALGKQTDLSTVDPPEMLEMEVDLLGEISQHLKTIDNEIEFLKTEHADPDVTDEQREKIDQKLSMLQEKRSQLQHEYGDYLANTESTNDESPEHLKSINQQIEELDGAEFGDRR